VTATPWASADAYERYIGRWSALVARAFLDWLDLPPGLRWLDVGCGTGMLSAAIAERDPTARIAGVDPSEPFLAAARRQLPDAELARAGAQDLPFGSAEFDAVVSGLVLNFVPDAEQAAAELARVARSGATIAAYVWDYAGEMQLIRRFFDAAIDLDPAAEDADEGPRFPICRLDRLEALFADAGLHDVQSRAIDVPTVFRDFDDYWTPFLGGVGPAGVYAGSLDDDARTALRDRLRATLPAGPDGSISLIARAHAVRARR
jgi:trans-aconitate methyltransferase